MTSIKVAQNDFDLERLIEFCHIVHDPEQQLEDFDRMLRRNPFNPMDSHYYIEIDGRIVSMISLLPSRQYFGKQSLKVGQIALVGTHPDFRKKGLAKQLMLELVQQSSSLDMPLYYLYGIPNFYEAFDFSFAIPSFHPQIEISREKIEHLPPHSSNFRIRKYRPSDTHAISELYHQTYSQNNCTNIRSREHWDYYLRHFGSSNNYYLKVVLDMKGEITGYVWFSKEPEGLILREAVSTNLEVSDLILQETYSYLKQSQLNTLYIQIPQNHLFAKHCYQRGAAFYSNNQIYYGVWGGMYRIMNIEQCMNPLLPLFKQRLSQSCFYDWKGTLNFQTQNHMWGLKVGEGRVSWHANDKSSLIEFPLPRLNACLTEYSGLDQIPLNCTLDEKKILSILFPTGYPFLSEIDNIDELV